MSSNTINTGSYFYISTPALNFTRTLQWCSQEIICFSDSEPHGENASWQFQISQDPMSYILVNLGKGQGSAMSSFLSPDTGLTQPGMAELNASDPRQHWDWQTMDPTKGYTVQNVANGTNWLLDVHNITSGTLSMSPSASLSQERWIVSSAAPISNAPAPASTSISSPSGDSSSGNTIPTKYIPALIILPLVVLSAAFLIWFRTYRRRHQISQETLEITKVEDAEAAYSPAIASAPNRPSQADGSPAIEKSANQTEDCVELGVPDSPQLPFKRGYFF